MKEHEITQCMDDLIASINQLTLQLQELCQLMIEALDKNGD